MSQPSTRRRCPMTDGSLLQSQRQQAAHSSSFASGSTPGSMGRVGELTAGAVALPAKDLTLATYDVPVLAPARSGRPRFMVSRTRPPAEAERVAEALGGELVPMGSAGAKAMAVLLGEGDAYVHSGGQYEWDSAAPVAVARAAGLH